MANGESERERFARLLFYGAVLLVGYLTFQIGRPFLAPLAWAAVFAIVFSPVQSRFARRLGPAGAASATTVVACLVIVLPAILVLVMLAREVVSLVEQIRASGVEIPTPARVQAIWNSVRQRLPFEMPTDLSSTALSVTQTLAAFVAGQATMILQNVASFLLQLFVMLFALFYFLRDGGHFASLIRELLPFEAARRDRIVEQTYELVVATVGSSFAVAAIQGSLTGLTLWALGFRSPVLWGVLTAFLSLLPVVGSGLVWGPAALWLFGTGDIWRGVILVAVGGGVISMSDNVLRPLLLSGRTTMHGLAVFISLMGGVAAFGFIGLVVGPIVFATLGTLLEAIVEKPSKGNPRAASA